jgi:hypothetical protein
VTRVKSARVVLALSLLLVLTAAACGDDDGADVRSEPSTAAATPRSASGSGTASGSGSVVASGSGSGSEPGGASGPACPPVGEDEDATTTVGVKLDEFSITSDATRVPAGTIRFTVDNVGEEKHEFVVVKGVAPGDLPLDDDGALDETALPAGALVGEIEPFAPGEVCDGVFGLAAGEYTLLCNVVEREDAKTESHLHEGMVTRLTVG